MNQEESQLRTEEVHLRDYIHVINKRRTLVVAVFAVIFVMVVLYTFSQTPLYRGTTKVLIEKASSEKLTGNSVSRIYDPEFYETQFQLIKSRAVAKRVVVSHDLADNFAVLRGGGDTEEGMLSSIFGWFGSVKGLIKGLIGDSQPVGEELASDLLTKTADLINEDIEVLPFKNSRLVTISYLAPSPEFAAMIANATAKAYIQETMEMKLESTRTQLEWMTKKATEEGEKLQATEQALQNYMVANDIISLENRMSVTPEQLSQISTQLVIAESKRKQLESLYSKVRSVADDYKKAETIPAIAVDPALQMIRSQILQAEQDLRELSGTCERQVPQGRAPEVVQLVGVLGATRLALEQRQGRKLKLLLVGMERMNVMAEGNSEILVESVAGGQERFEMAQMPLPHQAVCIVQCF